MIELDAVHAFLRGNRIAVIGASDDETNFGKTVVEALQAHGYDAVPVNPHATRVAGAKCYPDLAHVPGVLDGAIVMVKREDAATVVEQCAAKEIRRVWLFKGLGAPGAVSDDAVARCHAHGIDVVAGACPLMFLEPVGWFHRAHRGLRRRHGALGRPVGAA